MSRHWIELYDPNLHEDHMSRSFEADVQPIKGGYNVYFVEVCSFIFQFHTISDLNEAIEYFSSKLHKKVTERPYQRTRHHQLWFERLPAGLAGGSKRERVVKALIKAKQELE